MSITIQILTNNNEQTLSECLESLLPLDCEIIVGDFGSKDKTIKICKNYKIKIVDIVQKNNYSIARNSLVDISSTDWQFYIEPWEKITSGHEQITWALDQPQDAFKIYNIQ